MERSTPRLDQSNACKGYFWIDGELIEFEWNIGPGHRRRSFKRPQIIWMIDKWILNILEVESSSCQRSTIWIGQRKGMLKSVLGIPNKSRTTQKGFSVDTCRLRPRRRRQMVWDAHLQAWRKMENMVEDFKETGHPIFRGISALNRGVLKRRGWRCTVNPFHFGISECRAFVSHGSLSKSVMYLRSSSELVWRFGSADSWSNACDYIAIRRKGERSVISKFRSARCGIFSTDTKDERSSSGRPTAYSSKIWRMHMRYK